jgi:hypothetical protein
MAERDTAASRDDQAGRKAEWSRVAMEGGDISKDYRNASYSLKYSTNQLLFKEGT